MSTLTGRTTLSLTTRDGEPVAVTVSQVSPRKLLDYLAKQNEAERVLMTANLDENTLDTLDLESYEALVKEDERLNGPFASRRQERQIKETLRQLESMKTAMPSLYSQAEAQIKSVMEAAMLSAVSLPTPSLPVDNPGMRCATGQLGES